MKDELGLYYHPQAGNALSRVYVRRGPDGEVEFRLWRADHPEVWERHPWLSMAVVRSAARCEEREAAELMAISMEVFDASDAISA